MDGRRENIEDTSFSFPSVTITPRGVYHTLVSCTALSVLIHMSLNDYNVLYNEVCCSSLSFPCFTKQWATSALVLFFLLSHLLVALGIELFEYATTLYRYYIWVLLLTKLHNASVENTVCGQYLPHSWSVWWIISPYVRKFKESSVTSVYTFESDLMTAEINLVT